MAAYLQCDLSKGTCINLSLHKCSQSVYYTCMIEIKMETFIRIIYIYFPTVILVQIFKHTFMFHSHCRKIIIADVSPITKYESNQESLELFLF